MDTFTQPERALLALATTSISIGIQVTVQLSGVEPTMPPARMKIASAPTRLLLISVMELRSAAAATGFVTAKVTAFTVGRATRLPALPTKLRPASTVTLPIAPVPVLEMAVTSPAPSVWWPCAKITSRAALTVMSPEPLSTVPPTPCPAKIMSPELGCNVPRFTSDLPTSVLAVRA